MTWISKEARSPSALFVYNGARGLA